MLFGTFNSSSSGVGPTVVSLSVVVVVVGFVLNILSVIALPTDSPAPNTFLPRGLNPGMAAPVAADTPSLTGSTLPSLTNSEPASIPVCKPAETVR